MTPTLELLEAQVMNLPKADRARLLERLVASLDGDLPFEAEWEAVAESRETDLAATPGAAVTLDDALLRIRGQLAK